MDRPACYELYRREGVRSGEIRYREEIVDGLENAPQALLRILEEHNFGKVIIRVGSEGMRGRTAAQCATASRTKRERDKWPKCKRCKCRSRGRTSKSWNVKSRSPPRDT